VNKNKKNRTNNVIESKNKQIKARIGKKLSEVTFVSRAKAYNESQMKTIATGRNTTWEQLLQTPSPADDSDSETSSGFKFQSYLVAVFSALTTLLQHFCTS